ncbi:S9 family peptidase [Bacteroidota bacterium]
MKIKIKKINCLLLLILCFHGFSFSQKNLEYQLPPKEIVNLVDAPRTPSVSISPDGKTILLLEVPGMPTISDYASPMLRIAGLRLDPKINGRSRSSYNTGITIMDINGENQKKLEGLPSGAKISSVSWAPDGLKFAFLNILDNGIELWYADIVSLKAKKLSDAVINATLGRSFFWSAESNSVYYKSVMPGRGSDPVEPKVPTGPVVQENLGKEAAVRTYQDLLENAYDEALFVFYTYSQLMLVDLDKNSKKIGQPGIYTSINASPDGNYLLVNKLKQPFSYLVPYSRFPQSIEIWNKEGEKVHQLANIPLMESIPKGFGAAQPGPRSYNWRNDEASTIYWIEALDDGDPKKKVEYRDQVYLLKAPFTGRATKLIRTKLRYGGITWGNKNLAVISESWRTTRQSVTSFFDPENAEETKRIVFDRSSEDRYSDPGRFITHDNEYGKRALLFIDKDKSLLLSGSGASPEGNRPFVDKYSIETAKTKRLWRSEAPYYETLNRIIDAKKLLVITNRQSKEEPSNYYLRDLKKDKLTAITHFTNPYPQLQGVTKQLITYKRDDGVDLNATLYLPAGYKASDGPLPTILWAYPREFKSAAAAGQISGSPYTFTRMSPTSHLFWVTRGYAIIDGASFPIIGEGDQQPNDTFIKQLVANGKAAIDKGVEMGVTDRNRVAVGGHSYGAFMTANLLAHSNLFAAGIARSGAYNRTLTPFGFQAEPRTFWEAPEIYFEMSPFMNAHKVKTPILLIHGIADNNSGTFPVQSQRFYNALKGHGATTRLVMLPLESHGYSARESVLHMLWETDQWLEKYVKNK